MEQKALQGPKKEQPSPLPSTQPSMMGDEEEEFNLRPPPELEPDVERFFHVPMGECKEDAGGHSPTEPLAEEYAKWIEWRGPAVDTPDWWWELEMISEVDDVQELALKIQASFKLLQWMSKEHNVENYYLAPLAPHCIC